MKEYPILFSAPMVNAILERRKTLTRRVVKPQPDGEWAAPGRTMCPHGVVGDRLWVRETFVWNPDLSNPDNCKSPEHCFYRADGEIGDQLEDPDGFPGWKPSIFMPRWASRITLEITGIRVERLQDISHGDCFREGHPTDWSKNPDQSVHMDAAKDWFMDLWDSINGKKYPWASNPWVWVIEFKRI